MGEVQKGTEKSGKLLDKELARARVRVGFNPAEAGMAPLSLEVLVPGQPVPTDFFLPIFNKTTKKVDMTIAMEKGEVYKPNWRERLAKNRQKRVFVRFDDAEELGGYFERHAGDIVDSPDSSLSKKRRVIKEMASLNLRMLFGGDLSPKALDSSVKQARDTVTRLAWDAQLLTRLAEVLSTDYSVYSHSVNVCMLSMAFGRYLGMPESRVLTLGMAGLMHDAGVAKLPPDLVEKKTPLSPREESHMRQHPQLGYKMLLPIGAVAYDVLMAVLYHHENADGTGYPKRLKAEKTPYLARVLKVVDSFDAMTSDNCRGEALTAAQAASSILEDMNTHFGADLAPQFIRFLASPGFTQS